MDVRSKASPSMTHFGDQAFSNSYYPTNDGVILREKAALRTFWRAVPITALWRALDW